jgi:hypothetical protein
MNGKFLILGMTLVGAILCSVEAKCEYYNLKFN